MDCALIEPQIYKNMTAVAPADADNWIWHTKPNRGE